MQEHPFAPFVRILGKGKKGTRSLTRDEAYQAMRMILAGEVRPEQLGAFLMLLRVKEEAPEELVGFIEASRDAAQAPRIEVDLDWSSYAGKKRNLPWFLLTALLLAQNGTRVFMHGARGHTAGRLYTQDMLEHFGLEAAQDWDDVAHQLTQHNFAFMGLDNMVPQLSSIIELRNIFGLRSPVHTLCRMINPLGAKYCIDGVFHPAYAPMHQQTNALLGVEHSLTIRGDGGEAELRPDAECEVRWGRAGVLSDAMWPRLYPKRVVKDEHLEPSQLLALWRGDIEHHYGEGALLSTTAAALCLLDPALEAPAANSRARELWERRDKSRY
ncbi:MAG: glycosyl transferase family protein [Pseudomonadales bacterium]